MRKRHVPSAWFARGHLRIGYFDEESFCATAAGQPGTIHDHPAVEHHGYVHPVPGGPVLAMRIVARLTDAGLPADLDFHRGLDHADYFPWTGYLRRRARQPGSEFNRRQSMKGWAGPSFHRFRAEAIAGAYSLATRTSTIATCPARTAATASPSAERSSSALSTGPQA